MFKGSRKYWVIALICGLAAAVLSYYYIQELKQSYEPDNLVQIVKASEDIMQDTMITREQVEVQTVPRKYIHPQAVQDKNQAIGKIATSKISAGEAILQSKLLSTKDKASRMAYSIPKKQRAVSIPVDDVGGVAGFLRVGDRVDVVATLDIPVIDSTGVEKPAAFSVVSLQDIQVLAVGENPEGSVKKNSSGAKTITLAVSITEVQPLVLASERGKIRLLLRSPVDHSKAISAPYQMKDFLKQVK